MFEITATFPRAQRVNQFSPLNIEVLWHLPESNFAVSAHAQAIFLYEFQNCDFKTTVITGNISRNTIGWMNENIGVL